MKVLLLNPPYKTELGKFSRASRSPAITKSGTIYNPIWLAYACANLEKNNQDTMLLDSCADQTNLDKSLEKIKEYNPQLVIIDTSTPSISEDVRCAEEIKKILPEAHICLVGTHPSVLTDEVLDMSDSIDSIARHEYDATVVDLAKALEEKRDLSTVDGISYKNSGKHIHNKDRAYIGNLDDIPFVSKVYKKHLNINNYFFSAATLPMVMIMTGRGCPSRCFFCVYPQTFHGHKYRLRSVENVVSEFEWIVENLPEVKSIGIEDDTFTADPERAKEICRMLIKKGINKKVKWWANTRVRIDLELMRLMKKAGCRLIIPGFESGCQEILNNIHKGTKIEQAVEYMQNARKAGLLVHGCFMVGNKGETKETMEQTLKFAMKLNPDSAQFFPLIPYPGTEAFIWAKENGYIKTFDYSKWLKEDANHECVLNLPDISSEELVEFCDYARKKYYLRPKYLIYKAFQSVTNFDEMKRNLKAFKRLLGFLYS